MQTALQAAGHEGARQGEGLFIKPTTQNEIDFYQWIVHQPSSLSSFVPLFMGTLCEEGSNASANIEDKELAHEIVKPLIVLEDLCEGFDEPSIMDIKLGSILWDGSTPPEKRERLMNVSKTTTSGSLGFRIAGLTVIDSNGQRVSYGKQFGREATKDAIDSYLRHFWPQLSSNDYIYSALASIVTQLEQLHKAMQEEPLELHSASVLLMYEGNVASLKNKAEGNKSPGINGQEDIENDDDDDSCFEEDKNKLVDVRLIDFAHTIRADQPDMNVLNGLNELIKGLKRLLNSV